MCLGGVRDIFLKKLLDSSVEDYINRLIKKNDLLFILGFILGVEFYCTFIFKIKKGHLPFHFSPSGKGRTVIPGLLEMGLIWKLK